MGFLDKAKAAATELSAKADAAMSQAGINTPGSTSGTSASADRYLRDLGVLSYLEATGREAPPGERERVMAALRDAEQQGGLSSFALRTTPPPPPGTGGMPGAPGAPGGQTSPPPPPPPGAAMAGAGDQPTAPPPPAPPSQPPATQGTPPPPPPPPSGWS